MTFSHSMGLTCSRRLILQVAFVVEKAVKHESRITVGAFDGHVVEGSVIIREECIEFESEVAEACAVGLL